MDDPDRLRITQEIDQRVGPAWARIFSCLGPVDGLALWRTSARAKPVTRLVLSKQRFVAVRDDLAHVGLRPLVAPFAYFGTHPSDPLAAFHHGGFVQSTASADEDAVIYVALQPADAEQAMLCDLSEDHVGGAEFFGYPACCAQAFAAGLAGSGNGLAVIDRIGPFDSLLNPATRYFTRVRPIFHFPCLLDCPASRTLAHHGQADLANLSPRLAALADLGPGMLASRPGTGLFWYVRDRGDEAFHLVHAFAQNAVRAAPGGSVRLTVAASDDFAIDGAWCKEPGRRCAEFSKQAPPDVERASLQ